MSRRGAFITDKAVALVGSENARSRIGARQALAISSSPFKLAGAYTFDGGGLAPVGKVVSRSKHGRKAGCFNAREGRLWAFPWDAIRNRGSVESYSVSGGSRLVSTEHRNVVCVACDVLSKCDPLNLSAGRRGTCQSHRRDPRPLGLFFTRPVRRANGSPAVHTQKFQITPSMHFHSHAWSVSECAKTLSVSDKSHSE